ncbi:YihY/virulence factor BrkB family protein [Haloferacaceae archaeon DSL9]
MKLSSPLRVGRAVADEFGEKNVAFMAGSIAYNAFISLVPLLVLLFFAVSVVGSGELESRLTSLTMTHLTPGAGEALEDTLAGAEDGAGLSIIGFVALLWGTLKIFRGLDTAFAEIYETTRSVSFLSQIRDSVVVFVALSIAITAIVGASVVFAAFESRFEAVPGLGLVNPLLLVVGLSLAFFPLYYVFPDVDTTVRTVVPGVLFAAVGWAILQGLFQIYISLTSASDTYGALAGVILVITWLYFSGLVLLLGGVVNAVVGGYAGGDTEGIDAPGRVDDERTLLDAELEDDEVTRYLDSLREDVTGRYDRMRPTAGQVARRPAADRRLSVTERTYLENGAPHGEVTLRWRQRWQEQEA